MQEKRMVVFVEASVLEDPALARDPRFQGVRDKLQTFRDGTDELQVIIFSIWHLQVIVCYNFLRCFSLNKIWN